MHTGKKIGLLLPHWEQGYVHGTPRVAELIASACIAENCGMDSVWLVDHFLIEPYLDYFPYGEDDNLKGQIRGVWECWALVSAIAAATNQLQIGTLVSNTGYRNPALLSQMINTIDDLSEGRFIAGLGAGDFPAEHRKFGFEFERRVSRFEEALQIIIPLLRGEKVFFEGEFYQVDGAMLRPGGPSAAGPPLLVGVLHGGPRMNRLVTQYASDWNCWIVDNSEIEVYRAARDAIVMACRKHDRDPDTLRKNATVGVDLPGTDVSRASEKRIRGTLGQITDEIGRFLEEDIDHLSVYLRPFSDQSVAAFADILKSFR